MEFETWEPVYEAILADFGYDRAGDERARDLLVALLAGDPTLDPEAMAGATIAIADATVAIAGAASRLEEDLPLAREADLVFAASSAARRLREHGITVDCMVTDLDGHPETARALAAEGTPVAVHAHGDNTALLREWMPALDTRAVLPTTQTEPTDRVRNFGGFTDGDRAAFLADALGAQRLVFPGWTLDDDSVGAQKRRKLQWARRLLRWLESRRDEQFALLDGQRDAIDASAFEGIW
jgi:uncharacterized Rossmann fold enzyme